MEIKKNQCISKWTLYLHVQDTCTANQCALLEIVIHIKCLFITCKYMLEIKKKSYIKMNMIFTITWIKEYVRHLPENWA